MKKIIISLLLIVMMTVPVFATNNIAMINYIHEAESIGTVPTIPEDAKLTEEELATKYMPYGFEFNKNYRLQADGEFMNVYVDKKVKPVKNLKGRLALSHYDDVYLYWTKDPFATCYEIQFRTKSNPYWRTIAMSYQPYTTLKDLCDGYRYEFRIIPTLYKNNSPYYFQMTNPVAVQVTTLMKIKNVKAKYNDGKVKVSWTNIYGETGYQISRTIRNDETYIVYTLKSETANSKELKLLKESRYYKVRAFKDVIKNGETRRIFAPWSEPVRL